MVNPSTYLNDTISTGKAAVKGVDGKKSDEQLARRPS